MDITGLGSLFDFGSKIIDRFIPDPQAKFEATQKLAELQQNGELQRLASETQLAIGQQKINEIEANNTNLFVAGWRPFIGWVCGSAFAYKFVIQPFMVFLAVAFGNSSDFVKNMPSIDASELTTVMFGLLGLGAMRSFEKYTGVTK